MKYEKLKISIGNQSPMNLFPVFYSSYCTIVHGNGKSGEIPNEKPSAEKKASHKNKGTLTVHVQ